MMQAAREFMTALKDQPALLVLSISNFALLVFIFYALSGAAAARTEILQLITRCVGTT